MAVQPAPLKAGNNANQNGAQEFSGVGVLPPVLIPTVLAAPQPTSVLRPRPVGSPIG